MNKEYKIRNEEVGRSRKSEVGSPKMAEALSISAGFNQRTTEASQHKTEFSTVIYTYQTNRQLGLPADNFSTISLIKDEREITCGFSKRIPTLAEKSASVRKCFSPIFVRDENEIMNTKIICL